MPQTLKSLQILINHKCHDIYQYSQQETEQLKSSADVRKVRTMTLDRHEQLVKPEKLQFCAWPNIRSKGRLQQRNTAARQQFARGTHRCGGFVHLRQ